jgi:Ran GTPase-activating protein (RanGAP) involved in mRNA processing and transport
MNRYSTFEQCLSADGKSFSLVRCGAQQAAVRLEKVLQDYHSVQELTLRQIDLTPSIIHLLASLGHDRAWTSWTVEDCRRIINSNDESRTEEEQATLGRLAQSNVSSLKLRTTMVFPRDQRHFMDLELFLQKNATVETLTVSYHSFSEADARELASGLHLAKNLERLCLSGSQNVAREMPILVVGLQNNSSLESLDVGDCKLHDIVIADLIDGIHLHPKLEELNVSNNFCGRIALERLSRWLRRPDCLLKSVDLKMQRFRLNIVTDLSESLQHNTSLVNLVLSNTSLINEDVISLVDALVENKTLKNLSISDNRQVSDAALIHLASKLPKLSLKTLNLRKLENRGSEEVMEALSIGMEQNYELQWLKIHYWRHIQFTRRILFYANANRGGRRALKPENTPPLALWPKILERAQTVSYFLPINQHVEVDNVYNLLRNAPEIWESFDSCR